MSESTASTEKQKDKRTCPRCGEVIDKIESIWTFRIGGELGSVHVCKGCWMTLNDVDEKIREAKASFLRMVYEYPGHEKIAPGVAGHVVMTVRRSRKEELAKLGWDDEWPTDVLVLSSGAIVMPAEDEEWNDVGALCGIDKEGNTFEFEYKETE